MVVCAGMGRREGRIDEREGRIEGSWRGCCEAGELSRERVGGGMVDTLWAGTRTLPMVSFSILT